ncbi:MAG: Ig-like domain-containing protein [Phycisphaerae bacterium]|nr:Ig-like domain-containing protein [Phycisphaerae bacterium]
MTPMIAAVALAMSMAHGAGGVASASPLIAFAAFGACNADSRLNGEDVGAFVTCLLASGPDCECWDLNDNGATDAPDIPPLVATLLDTLPWANNDRYVAVLNAPINGNVLTNDLDPLGPGTTAVLITPPAQGTFNLAADGTFNYTPAFNVSGEQTFAYRAVNGSGASGPATVFLRTCTSMTASCDGDVRNGCETSLTTVTDCGACGVSCSLANATESCATGTCVIVTCDIGYADCDANHANGCEVSHAAYSNSCATPENLGLACGDTNANFLCPPTSFFVHASRSRRDSRWYLVRARECSDCTAAIQARITLAVPAGIDYDLFAYSACGTLWASSTNGMGQTEQLTLSRNDSGGSDDSYNYWIEVRWFSGASCSNWTLTIEGRD